MERNGVRGSGMEWKKKKNNKWTGEETVGIK